MAATAADYGWVRTWGGQMLTLGYCFTVVRLNPTAVLDRLGAYDRSTLHGVLALSEPACELWDRHQGHVQLVGVTAVGDWTFMAEMNGFVGVSELVMRPVAADTTAVAHYMGAHGVYRFLWVENGEVCLSFEPLFAFRRDGTKADLVTAEMEAAGFDLRDAPDRSFQGCWEAAFALAERLTGVGVTPELLDGATLECGLVPVPFPT